MQCICIIYEDIIFLIFERLDHMKFNIKLYYFKRKIFIVFMEKKCGSVAGSWFRCV